MKRLLQLPLTQSRTKLTRTFTPQPRVKKQVKYFKGELFSNGSVLKSVDSWTNDVLLNSHMRSPSRYYFGHCHFFIKELC